jgi:hypothetical protein
MCKMTDPMTPPMAYAIIKDENPFATFVSSVSSAIALLTTPGFPLNPPCRQRLRGKKINERSESLERGRHLRTIIQKEREKPNRIIEVVVPAKQNSITGLRPM